MNTIPTHPDYARHLQATRPALVMVPEPNVTADDWLWTLPLRPGKDARFLATWEKGDKAPQHLVGEMSPFGPPGSRVQFQDEWLLYQEWYEIARSELRHLGSITELDARDLGFETKPGQMGLANCLEMIRTIAPDTHWLWLGWRAEG